VTNSTGAVVGEQRYLPFGEPRQLPDYATTRLTDYSYTGQRSLGGDLGLMDYRARFYHPVLARFVQPDTIVPGASNPQAFNRYSYVLNRPTGLVDTNGHVPCKPGYRCLTPIADKRDLTTWVIAAAVDIAESSEMQMIHAEIILGWRELAWGEFYSLVKDGAKYDVKDKIELELGKTTKIGNNWYEFSTAGNILYGFYGKATGFTEFELRVGAGLAQLADYNEDPTRGKGPCSPPYYCDTEDDYAAVGFGMYLYDNYFKKDKTLTRADLLDAFEAYKFSDQMALRDQPKVFQPRYYEYRVDRFYQME
jgi:RHS repeat-associated protein